MNRPLNLLIVEDDARDAELFLFELRRAGFEPYHRRVDTPEGYRMALAEAPDIVLCDYTMPQFDAWRALQLLRDSSHYIPFIVVTGTIDEETAVACLKRGMDDYVIKENLARLAPAVEQALKLYEEQRKRQRLEEQLRHAQKMETVGTLASGVAHDINNALTVVFGHIEMARARMAEAVASGAETPEVLQHLHMVEVAAHQVEGMAQSLLTFSHRTPARKQFTCLREVCRTTAHMVARILPASVIQEWEVAEGRLDVLADGTQLQQVLMNLLVNACDAMPDGGTVRVSLAEQHFALADLPPSLNGLEGSFARLEVTDTGHGMSAEVRERLFEPFFTTKPRGRGTGLGLAIVHGIVRDHGGWIDVETAPGAGTTFSVYLPLACSAQTVPVPEPRPELDIPEGIGVLLVEDDDLVRATLAKTLSDAGYRVVQARDGDEALEAFRADPSALRVVVADADLRGMTGIQCLEYIRTVSPGIHGLVITGRREESDRHQTVQETASPTLAGFPVLLKPFQMKDLRREVGRLARNVLEETCLSL